MSFTSPYFTQRNRQTPFAEHNPFLYKVTCPLQIPLLELEGTQEKAADNITLGNAQTSNTGQQHIFNISSKPTDCACYLMAGSIHQCFMLVCVEALGFAKEIHTRTDRSAV